MRFYVHTASSSLLPALADPELPEFEDAVPRAEILQQHIIEVPDLPESAFKINLVNDVDGIMNTVVGVVALIAGYAVRHLLQKWFK
jgi:hypothetical protein